MQLYCLLINRFARRTHKLFRFSLEWIYLFLGFSKAAAVFLVGSGGVQHDGWFFLCLFCDEGSVKYSVHVPGLGGVGTGGHKPSLVEQMRIKALSWKIKKLRCAVFSVHEGKTWDKISRGGNKDWCVSIPEVECGSARTSWWSSAVCLRGLG